MIENQVLNAIYANGTNKKVTLSTLAHKGGASGKIFLIQGQDNKVAKIYHHTKKSSTNRKKLEAMLLNVPSFPDFKKEGISYTQIAWPEALLEDDKGFCLGYIMPLINMSTAVSLDHLIQKAVRRKLNLPESYIHRVFAAYNVVSMITALHKCGHYIVDLKPSNVYVYKENMMVAMIDCDGFSIQGEKNRYPAEFVSEEYIYPEGMELGCEDMGEEQDKFALAVVVFKLLNGGIHPFSGSPRKADEDMLTIQDRIEDYHYAYGLWPDKYQAPHPYSIHEYLDTKTLELFERSFTKGAVRPSSYEWQEHLWHVMHNLKPCKKNPDHAYYLSKGCGLCNMEDKFLNDLKEIKKQREAPPLIRGMEISAISTETVEKNKQEMQEKSIKMQNIGYVIIAVYFIFFALFYQLVLPIKDSIISLGIGVQAILTTLVLVGIRSLISKYRKIVPILRDKSVIQMLQVYAFICMLITVVSINDIPKNIFELAK